MYAHPCGRHWYSGSDRSDASHVSALAKPSALSGKPKKSPTHGFSVLSCDRTTVHSPEQSVVTAGGAFWATLVPAAKAAAAVVVRKPMSRLLCINAPRSVAVSDDGAHGTGSYGSCSVNERIVGTLGCAVFGSTRQILMKRARN